ncbi:MAG: response regulator [Deltaproteobacteria bacterium]|nr:response regulator [Deltaproteobacteria bacterium]
MGPFLNKAVMIVDDSSTMRQMVSYTLKGAGFAVQTAENGRDALKKLGSRRADLIITDVNMPVMDGLTLVRELRKDSKYRFVPILVLTTENTDEMKQRGRKAGATGWIVKPFGPEQLCQVSCRVLRLSPPRSTERANHEP